MVIFPRMHGWECEMGFGRSWFARGLSDGSPLSFWSACLLASCVGILVLVVLMVLDLFCNTLRFNVPCVVLVLVTVIELVMLMWACSHHVFPWVEQHMCTRAYAWYRCALEWLRADVYLAPRVHKSTLAMNACLTLTVDA